MLGLGDIVIPGTFVALALRYDYARYAKSIEPTQSSASTTIKSNSSASADQKLTNGHTTAAVTKPTTAIKLDEAAQAQFRQSAPKPYFYAALTAYVSGLATTMLVMHVFHAAQPALLYLR